MRPGSRRNTAQRTLRCETEVGHTVWVFYGCSVDVIDRVLPRLAREVERKGDEAVDQRGKDGYARVKVNRWTNFIFLWTLTRA